MKKKSLHKKFLQNIIALFIVWSLVTLLYPAHTFILA